MQDPKQFLLMHVEKIVLGVMALLLLLVLWAYPFWKVEVTQEVKVYSLLKRGVEEMNSNDWRGELTVPPEVDKIKSLYDTPWQGDYPPMVLPTGRLIFLKAKKGVIPGKGPVPEAPPVASAKSVRAKAERGQAVIVFQIDDDMERRALAQTAQPDYLNGLEYDHIEIYRIDRSGHTPPVLITPDNWLPPGLPSRYGAPMGAEMGPRSLFGVPVYVYAQTVNPNQKAEEEMRKRMEMEMQKRMEEEMRKRAEMDKKEAEDRAKREEEMRKAGGETATTPGPGPKSSRTTTTPAPYPYPSKKGSGHAGENPAGWYYFVDERIDPDVKYEYNVVIVCRNPVYPKYKDSPEKAQVPELVKSEPTKTSEGAEVQVASYKKWYFQGGSRSDQMEVGVFKVRSFVGGRREFTPEEIRQIVLELTGNKTATTTTAKKVEPEGEWVEQSFNARPGEEIGGKASVQVGTEKREVDFSTGCYVVAIQNDVQVSEDRRTVMVPGTLTREERVNRMVIPKLRLDYMDKKGTLKTKWAETVPALTKSSADSKEK